MKWLIIIGTWGLISLGAPLYVAIRGLSFGEHFTSWRSWLAFFIILIAFELREWKGRRGW